MKNCKSHAFNGKKKVNFIMLDVIIALMPSLIASIYFYKLSAVKVILASVISCVVIEFLWNLLIKREQTITDLSAVVTGLLMAFILPKHVPLWIPIIGGIFAIVIVKQVFGGLNQNFMNPAAAAKAFLLASWGSIITKTMATGVTNSSMMDKFLGQASGNIGETSILAILIGGLYLLIRGIISLKSTLSFLVGFIIFNYIFSANGLLAGNGIEAVMSGRVMLIAIFFINDKATTPNTTLGKIIFGAGVALVATIFNAYGNNENGIFYAVILLNLFAPMIKYYTGENKVSMEVVS